MGRRDPPVRWSVGDAVWVRSLGKAGKVVLISHPDPRFCLVEWAEPYLGSPKTVCLTRDLQRPQGK